MALTVILPGFIPWVDTSSKTSNARERFFRPRGALGRSVVGDALGCGKFLATAFPGTLSFCHIPACDMGVDEGREGQQRGRKALDLQLPEYLLRITEPFPLCKLNDPQRQVLDRLLRAFLLVCSPGPSCLFDRPWPEPCSLLLVRKEKTPEGLKAPHSWRNPSELCNCCTPRGTCSCRSRSSSSLLPPWPIMTSSSPSSFPGASAAPSIGHADTRPRPPPPPARRISHNPLSQRARRKKPLPVPH